MCVTVSAFSTKSSVISHQSSPLAAVQPQRWTAPCRGEGTVSEQWGGSADWTSAASPCADCTVNATLPSSGTATRRTQEHLDISSLMQRFTCRTKNYVIFYYYYYWENICLTLRELPCALDPLGCLGEECVWGLNPRFFALEAPCLCHPDMDDLQRKAKKWKKLTSKVAIYKFYK